MLTYLLANTLLAVAFGGTLLALVYCALRWPAVFVGLLLGTWVATVALRDATSLSLAASGYRISAMDVLAMVMVVIAIARFGMNGIRSVSRGLVLLLLLLLAIHILRGVVEFGFESGVNSSRTTLYFVAALAYAATVPNGWDQRIWKTLIVVGVVLASAAIPFWLSSGLGSADTSIIRNGEMIASRPVVAAGALLILQAAILVLALHWPSDRAARCLALGLGASVLLLQHRTVWAAALAVGLAGFFVWSARAGRSGDRAVFAGLGITLLLLPLAAFGLSRSDPLTRSVQEVTSDQSTFTWRAAGWGELIASHDSARDLATGVPSGTPFDRRVRGQLVDVSAHNGFVDSYVRFGLPGVVVMVSLGLMLWSRRKKVANAVGLPARAVALLVITQLAFSLAYSLDLIQGIIAGVLVYGLAAARTEGAFFSQQLRVKRVGLTPA